MKIETQHKRLPGNNKGDNVYHCLLGSAVHSVLGSPDQLSPHADLLFCFGMFPLPSIFLYFHTAQSEREATSSETVTHLAVCF
jgi:hypothetical protein